MSSPPGRSLRTRHMKLCAACEGEMSANAISQYCEACSAFLFADGEGEDDQPPKRRRTASASTDGAAAAPRANGKADVGRSSVRPARRRNPVDETESFHDSSGDDQELDDGSFQGEPDLDEDSVISGTSGSGSRRRSSRAPAKGKEKEDRPRRRRASQLPETDEESFSSRATGSAKPASPPRPKTKTKVRKPMTPPPEDSEEEEPEEEELPFGGKLAPAEADTRKFTPDEDDRDLFNRTAALSLKAEKTAGKAPDRKSGRKDDIDYGEESMPKISKVQIGDWEIETWYAAPYPEEYNQVSKLFICEFCLKYMKSAFIMNRHKLHCPLKHPPGDEIYRDDNVSVFEVDGRRNKIYCQNLCLIAKMFLDHKTLYYDVEPFLFYVICEYDERGYHFVGYFSKEKRSSSSYNLSCIVTLPTYQRKGYGNLLIELSYLLCRKEGKPGSPEKPLSDLGLLSYRNYWRTATIEALLATEGDDVSISDLVAMTGMTPDDIVNALDLCGFLRKQDDGSYSIEFDATVLEAYMERIRGKGMARVNPAKLRWTPHVWGPQTKPIEPPPKANEDGDGEEEEGGQEDGEEEHGEDGEGAGQETAPDGDGKDEAADDEAKDEGSPAADAGDDDPMAVDQPEGGLDPEDAEE